MAHHKSAQKRIRQTAKRRLENRYYGKTTRNALRKYLALTDATEAQSSMSTVVSMVDKLAKRNQIHKNKASNLKSRIMLHLNGLKK
ncbi:MAG TPA: 30S ribosomal protein S20 [Chitinophagales bacterium]|nr:30S ribosomal protein S20 [Chitinophagales bacterium]MCB0511084.1 30S ribosomal protein S20 [Bacteroidota bacterium]HMU98820.1 30S ribosomal protein S20 [Chitinophagales bacterium]HMV03608.1 30S ribosomal protein S20 [Chitinophagales bacterium]HMW95391.1 30S ribosomal protein S20 [Chitinophagales bacterium]